MWIRMAHCGVWSREIWFVICELHVDSECERTEVRGVSVERYELSFGL